MADLFLDACKFLASGNGTGSFVVASAVQGFQSPSTAGAVDGASYEYRAENASLSEWEVGIGTYTASTGTLTRDTIIASSNAGSAVNFTLAPLVGIIFTSREIVRRAFGDVYLSFSTPNLLLSPRFGDQLFINGRNRKVPQAGVTLAATGLSTGAYYVYASWSGSAITLSVSTTGYTINDLGIPLMTGDATKTLVGQCLVNSGPVFIDNTQTQIGVLSYFNRRLKQARQLLQGNGNLTSSTIQELRSDSRVQFLTWLEEKVSVNLFASGGTTANHGCLTGIGYDSTSSAQVSGNMWFPSTNTQCMQLRWSNPSTATTAERTNHFATIVGRSNDGVTNITWDSTSQISVEVFG